VSQGPDRVMNPVVGVRELEVDFGGYPSTIDQAARAALEAEQIGYDGWWAVETQIDAFMACAVACERTSTLKIGTGIAVAFARNPMTVALQANDLQLLSGGRFTLGLGSQIKPHITRRYSMPWSKPAARMREFVLAIRAIWEAWATGAQLDFQGEFYTHTLMSPFFDPGPNPYGNPKMMLAGVGPLMTEAAGEVADGFLCHSFSTERYMREVTIPTLRRGREKASRADEHFEIGASPFIVAGDTEAEIAAGVETVKQQIAFYGSTPAYRPVLDLHGWGDLHEELNALTKSGAWDKLAASIGDEVLHAFAVVGTLEHAVEEIQRRYGDLATRITLPAPAGVSDERWSSALTSLRGASAGRPESSGGFAASSRSAY
jgi:probable F420-dependent oxidoreductase